MTVSLAIPLWGIITFIITFVAPIIWSLITMYFNQKDMNKVINVLLTKIEQQDKIIDLFDDKIKRSSDELEFKLDGHKSNTDIILSRMNETLISTKTLVELLVNDKIKK